MAEVMSFEEIQNRFDHQWILLEDPQTTESLELKTGKVLCNSKDRDEIYRRARELQPKHSAILYVGKPTDEVAIIL